MNDWIIQGNMILRIALMIFVFLLGINVLCWIGSKKCGKLPYGDFILVGLLMVFIFFNLEGLRVLGQAIPDGINIMLADVDEKTSDLWEDVMGVRKTINDVYSQVNAFYRGDMTKDLQAPMKLHELKFDK